MAQPAKKQASPDADIALRAKKRGRSRDRRRMAPRHGEPSFHPKYESSQSGIWRGRLEGDFVTSLTICSCSSIRHSWSRNTAAAGKALVARLVMCFARARAASTRMAIGLGGIVPGDELRRGHMRGESDLPLSLSPCTDLPANCRYRLRSSRVRHPSR